MKLKNLTFNEYFELEDKSEFDFAIKYDKKHFNIPIDIFEIGDFTELSFKIIKDMQYYIETGLQWIHVFELIETTKGINQKDLGKILLVDLCKFKSYLIEEIYRINKIESISLAHTTTADEENAGLDDFRDLGSYLQFKSLANDDITKIEAIGKMKYTKCLLELVARKQIKDYQTAYMKIKSRK